MAFTDAQLTRIKGACLNSFDQYGNQDAADILSLIHRLEAAERYIANSRHKLEFSEADYEAWRKAKGD
jgi:hypothetical protein